MSTTPHTATRILNSSYDGVSGNPDLQLAAADDGASGATSQSEAHAALGGGLVNDVGHAAQRGASDPASGAIGDGGHGGTSSPSDAGGSAQQGSSNPEGTSQGNSEACGQMWDGCNHDWYCTHVEPAGTPGTPGVSQFPDFNPDFGISPIVDAATDLGLGAGLVDHVHGPAAPVSQLVDTTLDQLTGPPLHETVSGLTTNLGDVAASTLSQVTGLQLGGLTGELPGLLGDAVDDTLSQITGLHLGAVTGELTAPIEGLLDPSLSVTLGAADTLIAQAGGGVASSVETLVSPITDLGFLVSGEDSNGLVWQSVDTALSEVSGNQIVAAAGNVVDGALSPLLGEPAEILTGGDSGASIVGATALNDVSGFTQLASLGSGAAIASGGTIALPDAIGGNINDDLFTAGRYTDYGLALQSDSKSEVSTTADTLISPTDDSVSGSLPLLDSPHSQNPGTPLAQDADTTLAHSSSTLEDLGRDLSI